MKKMITLLLASVLLLLAGCGPRTYSGLSTFVTVMPNNEQIIFTYYDESIGQVYAADIESGKATKLYSEEKSVIHPIAGKSGTIYALRQNDKFGANEIISIDEKNKKASSLLQLEGEKTISSMAVSEDEQFIYYLQAEEFSDEKPVKGKRPHNFDVYEFNIKTKDTRRVTELNAYHAEALTIVPNSKHVAFTIFSNKGNDDKDLYTNKVYEVNVETGKEQQVFANINEMTETKDLYTPGYSDDMKFIAFTGVTALDEKEKSIHYEIFVQDEEKQQATSVTKVKEGYGPTFLHDSHNFIFTDRGNAEEEMKYYFYDMEAKKMTEIPVKIDIKK